MRKNQSFFVFKFNSSRLRDTNYNIPNLTLDEARLNGEVIRLSDSELLRAIRRIRGIYHNQESLDDILRKKKKRKYGRSVSEEIDKILYVPDIVNIEFDDARHYKSIISKGGLSLNGKKYVRLLASAGMTRRSTAMFCNSEIIDDLRKFLNNGRDESKKIVPAKYGAYVALSSTATLRVTTPRFVVISDCEIERQVAVDFLHESADKSRDPIVSPETKLLKFNLFDGQGLISPTMGNQWGQELQIDYLPSSWVFRGAFLKGLLVTFDFHEFARRHNISTIVDVYGNTHYIDDVDVIISTSQLKLWDSYSSIDDYRRKCAENDYSWGISRCSPKKDKDHAFATYQYLQNLDITTDEQIQGLCKKTIDWFNNVTGEDWIYTTLFLMGDVERSRIDEEWFNRLDNPLLQVLLLEPRLIGDKQIQQRVQRLIAKKIKESYLGVLLLNGNYEFMISDPFAQAEWALGLQPHGLLKADEHYSQYWNTRNKNSVSAIRSPMTWRSENNILNLRSDKDTSFWYKYIYSGIVFNVFGTDAMRMSGSDNDGDICLTTDQKEFIDCAYRDCLPPLYERKIAEKKDIIESELWEYDIKTFKSRIGLITNIGTQLFAMLSLFEKDSEEYREILNRLKICNCFQSMEIDRAKGIETMDIPRYWTKWEKIDGGESQEELHIKELHHRTIADKRPYFFRYLYPNYDRQYKGKLYIYGKCSYSKFNKNFFSLLQQENRSTPEDEFIARFYKYNPLLDSDCAMNRICHYAESQISVLREKRRAESYCFEDLIADTSLFRDKNRVVIESIYKKYRQYKVSINYHSNSSGFQQMMHWLNKQADDIIATSEEIVYWASQFGSSFLLDVFADDLIELLKSTRGNEILMPIKTSNGYIDYMNAKYEVGRFVV